MKFNKLLSGFLAAAMTALMIPSSIASAETYSLPGGGQKSGDLDGGYHYELWIDSTGGNGSMTVNSSGGEFDAVWDCSVPRGNYLARNGKLFDRKKKATEYGTITMDYEASYQQTGSNNGNSRLCVYGWMIEPSTQEVIEYYIIEDWVSWVPSPDGSFAAKTVTIDGGDYDIFWIWHEGPTIKGGSERFKQYFSVRKNKRTSGRITVSDHFAAWENAGMKCFNLTEVALNAEGYQSSGRANVTKNEITIGTPKPTEPTEPPTEPATDGSGFYFHSTFEDGLDGWSERGEDKVASTSDAKYKGSKSAAVTNLSDYWNGLGRTLDSSVFKPGGTYSFSAMAMQNTTSSEKFKLSLEYTDASGQQNWDTIAEADGSKGEWVQLANTAYTIPAGASGMLLYVETDETTTPFFVDEAVGGVKGAEYKADGVKPTNPPVGTLMGDVNSDKKVDMLDIVALQKYLLGLKQSINNDASDLDNNNVIDIFDLGILKGLVIYKQNNPDPEPTEPPTEPQTEPPTQPQPQRVDGVFYNTADVSWIDPSKPMIALAFDDGPIGGSQNPTRIQDAISKNGGHSTFFYWGERIPGNEAEIKRAQSLGMEIANHTWTHPHMDTLSADQQRQEIMKTADKLTEITGQTDFLIRPPYLEAQDGFKSVAKSCNSALISGSIMSNDWGGASKDQIVGTIKQAMQNGSANGAVVLLHENYDTTAAAIEELAPYLKSQGWQMVTVSEMFKANGKTLYNGQLYNKVSDAR